MTEVVFEIGVLALLGMASDHVATDESTKDITAIEPCLCPISPNGLLFRVPATMAIIR